MTERYDRLSRADLTARLRAEMEALRDGSMTDAERLAHELCVGQLELELKNCDLHDASRQAQDVRETLDEAVETAANAILELDGEGSIVRARGATENFFGIYDGRLVGRPLAELVHDADRWKLARHLSLIRAGEQNSAMELRLRHTSGRLVRASLDSRTFADESDGRKSCQIRLVDITQQRQAEAEARRHIGTISRAARFNALGEMASGVAHELSQPLSAIVAYARAGQHLLKDDRPNAAAELELSLEKVARQAERAGEVIRRIRSYVRKELPHLRPHTVAGLLQHALAVVDDDIQDADIAIHVEGTDDDVCALVDAIFIEQVLVNLLRNAIESVSDARPYGREIAIRVAQSTTGWIQVSLTDNGNGFGEGDLEQWFMPFVSGRSGSMGLGLSLSRSLVEAHGGHLWAEPVAAGGAQVCFTIPTESAS